MKDIRLLQMIRNKKDDILKDIEDVDARYDEGNGELYSGDYTEMRDALDNKLEVVNEILNEYEKVKKQELEDNFCEGLDNQAVEQNQDKISSLSFSELMSAHDKYVFEKVFKDIKSIYMQKDDSPELSEEQLRAIATEAVNDLSEDEVCSKAYWACLNCTFTICEAKYLDGIENFDLPLEEKIVDYIVDTACKNTATGEWSICYEDVCEALNISEDEYFGLLGEVVDELCKRDEIIDVVEVGTYALDLSLDVDYCKKFEGRIYEYKNGELKKKESLADKIEEAAGQVKSDAKSERENEINKER